MSIAPNIVKPIATSIRMDIVKRDPYWYYSNFSSGTDGWDANNGTVAGNIDSVGGQNDNLRFTINGTTGSAKQCRRITTLVVGIDYQITGEFYIPSSNTAIDGLRFLDGSAGINSVEYSSPTLDQWNQFVVSGTAGNPQFVVRGRDGGNDTIVGNGTDVFYIRNIEIREI